VEQYDDVVYVIFYDINYDEETHRIDEHKMDIFFGPNFLVTIHRAPIAEIGEVAGQWQRNADLIERGTGVLVYSLFETIIEHYFNITDRIATQIETMEMNILGDLDKAALEGIFALKRELITLHRVVGLERDVMAMLARRDLHIGGEAVTIYFQDLYDHVLRFTEQIESYREMLGGVLEEYLSMFANKLALNANDMASASGNLNHVMKVLTSYSIILGVVTMISSVYGMNFVNMPELHARYGYFVVLGVMTLLAVGLGIFFKRKTWL
jgi:magnesium transporter